MSAGQPRSEHKMQNDISELFNDPGVPAKCGQPAETCRHGCGSAALEARHAKTRDLKQAMMQALLTGRIRLA